MSLAKPSCRARSGSCRRYGSTIASPQPFVTSGLTRPTRTQWQRRTRMFVEQLHAHAHTHIQSYLHAQTRTHMCTIDTRTNTHVIIAHTHILIHMHTCAHTCTQRMHTKGNTSDHYQAHLRTHTTLQHHTIARDYTITLDRTMCLVFFLGQRILRNCFSQFHLRSVRTISRKHNI